MPFLSGGTKIQIVLGPFRAGSAHPCLKALLFKLISVEIPLDLSLKKHGITLSKH